jgi:acetylornithine deacetylase/succinyl-diaminopimelate desuccinylase-like protein
MSISKTPVLSVFVCLIVFMSTSSIAQKTKSSLAAYEKYIDDNKDAHLKDYLALVSIPTISSIPSYKPDVERAAAWIANKLKVIGMPVVQLMQGGYTAPEGHSNIIPGNALARITCRLVNNQDGKEIVDLIIKHINKNCPPGAQITYKLRSGYASPVTLPTNTKEYRYISDVLTEIYGKEPYQYASGGSVGAMRSVKEVLGLYAYPLGFELTDEKWHAANEFFRLSSIRKGQLIYCYYLLHLADEERDSRSYGDHK